MERRGNPHVVELAITTVHVDCFVVPPRNDAKRRLILSRSFAFSHFHCLLIVTRKRRGSEELGVRSEE